MTPTPRRKSLSSVTIRAQQQWKLSPAGGGLYQIAVSDSGAALRAAAGGGLELTPFTGADNQFWRIDQLSDGCYRIAATLSKQVLTAMIKTEAGNGVALEPFTGDDAKRWAITAP